MNLIRVNYLLLLRQKELATEILDAPGAPPGAKTLMHISGSSDSALDYHFFSGASVSPRLRSPHLRDRWQHSALENDPFAKSEHRHQRANAWAKCDGC